MITHMYLCPECGNKRCPRAAHKGNVCTGSNEPGQPGSNYPRTIKVTHEEVVHLTENPADRIVACFPDSD